MCRRADRSTAPACARRSRPSETVPPPSRGSVKAGALLPASRPAAARFSVCSAICLPFDAFRRHFVLAEYARWRGWSSHWGSPALYAAIVLTAPRTRGRPRGNGESGSAERDAPETGDRRSSASAWAACRGPSRWTRRATAAIIAAYRRFLARYRRLIRRVGIGSGVLGGVLMLGFRRAVVAARQRAHSARRVHALACFRDRGKFWQPRARRSRRNADRAHRATAAPPCAFATLLCAIATARSLRARRKPKSTFPA